MISRRKFITLASGLAIASTAIVITPELLTSKRTYFLPPKNVWTGIPFEGLIIAHSNEPEYLAQMSNMDKFISRTSLFYPGVPRKHMV